MGFCFKFFLLNDIVALEEKLVAKLVQKERGLGKLKFYFGNEQLQKGIPLKSYGVGYWSSI